jgi:hypothetical protein
MQLDRCYIRHDCLCVESKFLRKPVLSKLSARASGMLLLFTGFGVDIKSKKKSKTIPVTGLGGL